MRNARVKCNGKIQLHTETRPYRSQISDLRYDHYFFEDMSVTRTQTQSNCMSHQCSTTELHSQQYWLHFPLLKLLHSIITSQVDAF